MAYTDINSEDRLVQATFAFHLEKVLGWESVYAWNQESFGPTFARLLNIANSLDAEQRRAVELGLTEEQLALFDLLRKESLSGTEREKIKQASRDLLAELQRLIAPLEQWTEKEQTQAEVEVFILDHVYQSLPEPPYTAADKKEVAELVYRHIWQQSASGLFSSGWK